MKKNGFIFFILIVCFVFIAFPAHAIQARLSWLPEGRLSYQAFSRNPDRLPEYTNTETYKSFLVEIFWRHPQEQNWGMDFRALQAGRTAAQERVGNYQTSPLILSVQHWELLVERELIGTHSAFLSALGGMGAVTAQWERTKDVFVNGVKVNTEVGLADEGAAASGLRTSVENISIPLGARWRWAWQRGFFTETLMQYSFLMDFTDFMSGSSPFSGWSSQLRLAFGKQWRSGFEVFGGWFGYTNHMAAPAGQGGLRLRAGPAAPEGMYVLYQENEINFSAVMAGFGFRF